MKNWIRSSLLLVALTGFITAPLAEAEAATYLKLKGAKSGQIQGSATGKGFEKKINVESISHEIVSPRDASSGLPTGKRQHKPFVITKRIDKASPMLNNVLVNNENLTEWMLEVTGKDSKGQDTVIYTIKLTNATVASIKLVTDEHGNHTEVVSFTYQKIEWIWKEGGITADDDWESPVK